MRDPVITSLGLACGLGLGREALLEAWRAGGEGTRVERMPLRGLFPQHRSMLRRMDRLSKMICLAAGLARDDGGLGDPEGMALAVGTDFGTLQGTWKFLSRLRDKGPALANPVDFPNLVPNAGAGYAGIFCGLRGPSQTFCQHETCGDEAVAWAADGVRTGWFDAGLAGGAEELGEVRERATEAGGCMPAVAAGEGAAMMVVESQERARLRGARPLAVHLGSWAACGSPYRSPYVLEPDSAGMDLLLHEALDAIGRTEADIGVVLASSQTLLDHLDAPRTDHARRLGVHPADGAFRLALAACLLADPSLPVHTGGRTREGSIAVVASAARGGSLRLTLLGEMQE